MRRLILHQAALVHVEGKHVVAVAQVVHRHSDGEDLPEERIGPNTKNKRAVENE